MRTLSLASVLTSALAVSTLAVPASANTAAPKVPRFDEAAVPAAPDYAKDSSWAALPGKRDGADVVPLGAEGKEAQRDAKVDVFFIHPTTTFDTTVWNAPIEDAKARDLLDAAILRAQASVFNGIARVYAPRYRQATGNAFFMVSEDGGKALDLAYQDVEKAFEHFVTRLSEDRPFILASHSQGSLHMQRLLLSKVSGTPLVKRLVAVYAIGYPLAVENVPTDIPVASFETQTGGLVSWNTFIPGAETDSFMKGFPVWVGGRYQANGDRRTVQVNPLNWSTAPLYAPASAHLGALPVKNLMGPLEKLIPGFTGAQISDVLYIEKPRTQGFNSLLMGARQDNYHSYDYHMFYGNIRRNAAARVGAFFAASK